MVPNANSNSIAHKNVLAWRVCEKLYLDNRTGDVFFTFNSELSKPQKIPAHKSILSAISPVFDAMFYGPAKERGDVKIVDASPEAFREFLQFFYISTVILTRENIPEVMNLGKKYKLDDCINVCTAFCESTLTLDNMCFSYELALLFEQKELEQRCESMIIENPEGVLQSNSFLNCELNLVRHILKLNLLGCAESVLFEACMAWAKVACIRKDLDEDDVQNLRSQLGNLVHEINFARMSIEEFFSCYRSYDGLLSLEEYKDITMMIGCNEQRSTKFNNNLRMSLAQDSGVSTKKQSCL